MTNEELVLKKSIRRWMIFFITGLVISGITAFPLEWELSILAQLTRNAPAFISEWASNVYAAIRETNWKYPFMSYGTDWLAFAHIVIAVSFIGPLRDPVRNIWVIQFGMIACAMVFPLAFIAGAVRGIPFYWRLVDCSFGVIGIIPLKMCYDKIRRLEKLQEVKFDKQQLIIR
jgi:hypothetical protein